MAGVKEEVVRESGFYWVKCHDEWTIARWEDLHWEVVGCGYCMNDHDFDSIGDKIQMPEKYRES